MKSNQSLLDFLYMNFSSNLVHFPSHFGGARALQTEWVILNPWPMLRFLLRVTHVSALHFPQAPTLTQTFKCSMAIPNDPRIVYKSLPKQWGPHCIGAIDFPRTTALTQTFKCPQSMPPDPHVRILVKTGLAVQMVRSAGTTRHCRLQC